MKRKILSAVVALAMVFSMTAVSFADTKEVKGEVTISSDSTVVKAVAYDDYSVVATIDGDTVNKNEVTASVMLKNVAGLGVEGVRQASLTVTGNVNTTDATASLYDNCAGLRQFTDCTINASVNGKAFSYDIEGSYVKGDGEWTATPDSEAAVRAAWQELCAHISTSTTPGDNDSYAEIPSKAYLQIGGERLVFEDGVDSLKVDDVNSTRSLIDEIKASVKLVEGGDDIIAYAPAGTVLKVGESKAVLEAGTTIKVTGLDIDGTPLSDMRDATNGTNEELVLAAVNLFSDILISAQGETIGVEIITDCYNNADVDCPCDDACCEGCDPTGNTGGEGTTTPEGPTTPATPSTPAETPETGDNTPIALLGAIMLMSMIAAGAVFGARKVRVK